MNSTHCHRFAAAFSRRDFLRRSAFGFGASALGALMAREASAATENPLAPKLPHFPAKAQRVIFIFASSGASGVAFCIFGADYSQ